jgi:hypothetical protein
MADFTWSDQIGSRGRAAWLLIRVGDAIVPFQGKPIHGTLAIVRERYTKQGKWSHTTYDLRTSSLVDEVIPGKSGWDTGTFAEGLAAARGIADTPATWAEMASALGVSVPAAQRFLRSWRPKAAERIDKTEAEIAAVATAPEAAAEIVNLTPHSIVLRAADGSDTTIPPSGAVARVAMVQGADTGRVVGGVPVFGADRPGAVEGLSDAAPGVVYIVSALVGAALAGTGRADVVTPGTGPADGAIRNAAGHVVAVARLKAV